MEANINTVQTVHPTEVPDFRLFLQEELVERLKSNPRYSLRAFARALKVDPSLLSKILRGKRRISRQLLPQLVQRLDLSPAEAERYLATDGHTQSATASYKQITLDHFHLISDWYHYAIFELVSVKGFCRDFRWIARALGITVPEAQAAVERLFRLGLLKEDAEGGWQQSESNITTIGSEYTATALRRMQKQILEMGIVALENTPVEERDQTAMTMAIDSSLLPEARKRIKRFRRELCDLLQKDRPRDGVYHLAITLYPVARPASEGTEGAPPDTVTH
jgi:uncharacterized protein (TIGR02147 family)